MFKHSSSLSEHSQTMQISLNASPSKFPSLPPFLNIPTFKSIFSNNHSLKQPNALHKSSPASSSYVSLLGRAIEEEEYRKARAEVNRKGIDLEGYTIEGVSIGGHETCVVVNELKCVFDIGRFPSKAVNQNFLFITHAHLDHIRCWS